MQNLFHSKDRAHLEAQKEVAFIESCKSELIEKSLADTNRKGVFLLTTVSFLPNGISAITAAFFVIYLLSGYQRTPAIILGALLLIVVAALELGKRFLIRHTAKRYFTTGKASLVASFALLILMAASMGASYQGGKALVVSQAEPPAKEENPEIAALQMQLADISGTVDKLRKTTWRGKVTVDAVRGINRAQALQASLLERLNTLQAQDDATHAAQVSEHTEKHVNFGYLLGGLAALADIFLFGLLWHAWRLKYEVVAVQLPTPNTSKHGSGVTYAGSFQDPTLNRYTQAEPATVRRPIGFVRDPLNDIRITDPDTGPVNDSRYTNVVMKGTRICEHCGKAYEHKHSKQRFCSENCRIAAWQNRTGKTFSKHKK